VRYQTAERHRVNCAPAAIQPTTKDKPQLGFFSIGAPKPPQTPLTFIPIEDAELRSSSGSLIGCILYRAEGYSIPKNNFYRRE
jgi:hypothetical protein